MQKKVLIIDDSALMRRVLSDIINERSDYEATSFASNGLEGYRMITENPGLYDAVILDINMPKMSGLELLKKLYENHISQKIIIVSSLAKDGAKETIEALEYGAFEFITKPENYLLTKGEEFKRQIYGLLDCRTCSEMKAADVKPLPARKEIREVVVNRMGIRAEPSEKVVALACSTGGPKSLHQIIPLLPKNLNAGVVIVQHMPKGFTFSLAQRLNELSGITVKEAQDGDIVKKGNVYIAPGGQHLQIVSSASGHVIRLNEEAPVEGLRPCANIMYHSLEKSTYQEVVCVVLTGMGSDGTKGIKGLWESHKKIHVISQNEETCVVYGMPKAIAMTGLVDEVLPLDQIASAIIKNVGVS